MMTTMEPITLLIAALATARITLLITRDRITHAPRRWLLSKLDPEGLAAYLLVCAWCASVYVGGAVAATGAVYGLWAWMWALPLALAFSCFTGVLVSALKEDE